MIWHSGWLSSIKTQFKQSGRGIKNEGTHAFYRLKLVLFGLFVHFIFLGLHYSSNVS